MVDLLEQIRAAVDELTPLLQRRSVDIEMPRLTVGADAVTLQRTLVAVIGDAVEHSDGALTVRTTKRGGSARIEVVGERSRERVPAVWDWPAALVMDVEAMGGRLGTRDAAVVSLTVPLSGSSTPE